MNKNLLKTLIKQCNACFLALKGLINRLQNFWKLHLFWDILHKPWYNIIKILKYFFEDFLEDFLKNILKNISPKVFLKAIGCSSCYPVCTL
jgi:hypothetical protein